MEVAGKPRADAEVDIGPFYGAGDHLIHPGVSRMGADQRELRKIAGDPVEVNRPGASARHGFEDVPRLHGNRQPHLLALSVQGVHLLVIEGNVVSVDMNIHPFVLAFFDVFFEFEEALPNIEGIVICQSVDSPRVFFRHLGNSFGHIQCKPCLPPVRPSKKIRCKDRLDTRFVHRLDDLVGATVTLAPCRLD